MTAMEQDHTVNYRNEEKIFIHIHRTSENTIKNFVDSFYLRTQPDQQLWHWAEPGFSSHCKGNTIPLELKPLQHHTTSLRLSGLCHRRRLTVGSRESLEMPDSGL